MQTLSDYGDIRFRIVLCPEFGSEPGIFDSAKHSILICFSLFPQLVVAEMSRSLPKKTRPASGHLRDI